MNNIDQSSKTDILKRVIPIKTLTAQGKEGRVREPDFTGRRATTRYNRGNRLQSTKLYNTEAYLL